MTFCPNINWWERTCDRLFSRSTEVTSTDLVSAKGKTKEVYCCDIVVLIVLFWCFWRVKDCNVVSVYWNIVWWSCETISISWLLFSPLPKLGQLISVDRENPCGNFGDHSFSSFSFIMHTHTQILPWLSLAWVITITLLRIINHLHQGENYVFTLLISSVSLNKITQKVADKIFGRGRPLHKEKY